MADRTFVMVLPGVNKPELEDRIRSLRQVGFTGALAGMMAPRKTAATAILGKIAAALQKASPAPPAAH